MPDRLPLPQGFRTAGLYCGIKPDPQKFDLGLFVSDAPCTAAAVFTQNRVCGAPVKVSRERVPRGTARAVIINSGNANACTGVRGIDDAQWMAAEVARALDCPADDVLICSTGVIGRFLPREKLAAGIPAAAAQLAGTPEAFAAAARSMMTTDTFPKQALRQAGLAGTTVRVAGAAKGAAMIGPNMATMLAVILTDAPLTPEEADRMLRQAVDQSFNCISVEGHTSTSDTVILLANGAAFPQPRTLTAAEAAEVQDMLEAVCTELAQMIVRDAEGAGHFITIDVRGLRTREDALRIAKAVANGPLIKTAIAGNDPNWGRIVSAVGCVGIELAEEDISLAINGLKLYERGAPVEHDPRAVSDSMRTGQVHIQLDLPLGDAAVRFWTSDLTAEYVRLNADYTT